MTGIVATGGNRSHRRPEAFHLMSSGLTIAPRCSGNDGIDLIRLLYSTCYHRGRRILNLSRTILVLDRIRPSTVTTMAIHFFPFVMGPAAENCLGSPPDAGSADMRLGVIDLNDDHERQVVVDREKGQYLGHPTTVLLEDGKTILCVYPKGHGRGAIVYKRSTDGGKTWSDRLPTPANWATSLEVPTLHRVIDAEGTKRIIMFSGLYPCRMAVSEDDGRSWSPLRPVGDWGGVVTMASVVELATGPGHYLALFHDDGRFLGSRAQVEDPKVFTLYSSRSEDGGLTWSDPEPIVGNSAVHLCEPGAIRSPDGGQLAVLLRENSRRKNSHIMFSNDEGRSWSQPRQVPEVLNGDRHTGKYAPDGRLFISFRSRSPREKTAPFEGDWVAWVGTYDDLTEGRDGQYLVRIKDNHKGSDCAYPGVEVLPDGTIVTTTYGHWEKGAAPYILCVRLKLKELDAIAE